MLETSNNVLKVDDVSKKTIKILLHYFYTSNLLPIWCDEDVIVEFTYAAGKYEIALVLELLDDLLGIQVIGNAGNCLVQLLSLAWKLCLKKAEMRLLLQVKNKVEKMESSDELYKIFGRLVLSTGHWCKSETGWGKGENLQEGNDDKYDESTLKLIDYALRTHLEEQEFNSRDLQVLALVRKYSMKNVESILLARFLETVSKV